MNKGKLAKNSDNKVAAVRSDIAHLDVRQKIIHLRDQPVILDVDVAELYGVPVKRVNEQVRRNSDRFPESFVFKLSSAEFRNLKSQIAASSSDVGLGRLKSQFATSSWGGTRKAPKVFTEKGLYMLATVLKSRSATEAAFAIIETFAKVRELKRELVELHTETNKQKRVEKMQSFGELLTDIVMPDLETVETESSLELNFFIGKLKHTVRRIKRVEPKE